MPEARKHKRRHLLYYLRVFDAATGELLGHLVDITREGIMLISDKPFTKDKAYSLRMMLPKEMNAQEDLVFDATCVWCKPDVNPQFQTGGFRLGTISSVYAHIIETLIEEIGFRD